MWFHEGSSIGSLCLWLSALADVRWFHAPFLSDLLHVQVQPPGVMLDEISEQAIAPEDVAVHVVFLLCYL